MTVEFQRGHNDGAQQYDGRSQESSGRRGPHDWSQQHWQEQDPNATGTRGESPAPQLELVVSRGDEDLAWIPDVPFFWQITILNRGGEIQNHVSGDRVTVQPVNAGSDSEAFADFLVSRYNDLAEYTVFSPALPLQFSPFFLQLLQQPTKLGKVQPLAGVPTRDGKWLRIERISMRTLNSVLVHDQQTVSIAKWFSKDYNLTWGANLLKNYFDQIGLPTWMDERQEVGSAAPGALIGFERSRAQRHPASVYEKLKRSATVFGGNHLVIERLWAMLFAGSDFHDPPLRVLP